MTLYPRTKTLISFVCKLNRENIRCVSRAVSDLEFLQTFHETNIVARKVVRDLTAQGIGALNYSSGFPMDLNKWPGKMWSVSHKPVAVAAGMGHMGRNGGKQMAGAMQAQGKGNDGINQGRGRGKGMGGQGGGMENGQPRATSKCSWPL